MKDNVMMQAIDEKLALVAKIREQMADDVDNGVVSARTQECLHLAEQSFASAKLNLEGGKYNAVVYLYGRGSWNLGELMGRSAYERKEQLSNDSDCGE